MGKEQIKETIANVLFTLKELRTLRGYSLEKVAEGIGVSRQVYNRIENGDTELTITRIKQLADFYSIEMYEVIGYQDNSITTGKIASLKKQMESYKSKLIDSQQEVIQLQREQKYKGL